MGPNRAFSEPSPADVSSTPVQTTIGTTAGLLLPANQKRKGLIVQNTGTTIIKINLGTTDPTQTVYHVALKSCTVLDDGTGGTYFDDAWIGPVRVISSGAGGTLVVTEVENVAVWEKWNAAGTWGTP